MAPYKAVILVETASGGSIPPTVAAEALVAEAMDMSVELTAEHTAAGAMTWTFLADETDSLRHFLESGILRVAGVELAIRRQEVHEPLVVAIAVEGGPLASITTATALVDKVKRATGKSITVVSDAPTGEFTFKAENDREAAELVSGDVLKYLLNGVSHKVRFELVGHLTVPAAAPRSGKKPCKIREIEVYHDGENCPIPKALFMRDAAGNLVLEPDPLYPSNLRARVASLNPTRDRLPQGSRVYDGVLRTALACVEGEEAAMAANLVADVAVSYTFVLNPVEANPFHPSARVCDDLVSLGVQMKNPGTKLDAVCAYIKDCLRESNRRNRLRPQDERDGVLVVLVTSGDRDFVDDIRALRAPTAHGDPGIQVVLVSSRDAPVRLAQQACVAPHMARDNWVDIVESARGALPPVRDGLDSRAHRSTPASTTVSSTRVSKAVASFLRRNGGIAILQAAVEAVHPAFTVDCVYQADEDAEHKGFYVWLTAAGSDCGSLSSVPASAGVAATGSGCTADLSTFPDAEQRASAGAALCAALRTIKQDPAISLTGVLQSTLVNNMPLNSFAAANKVALFVHSQASGVRIPSPGEIFVTSGWTDQEIVAHCEAAGVRIQRVVRDKAGIARSVQLDTASMSAKDIDCARTTLLRRKHPLIAFSEAPDDKKEGAAAAAVAAAAPTADTRALFMMYPAAWRLKDVEALKTRHCVAFTIANTFPLKKGDANRRAKILCTPAEAGRIRCVHEKDVQFTVWKDSGSSGGAAAAAASTPPLLGATSVEAENTTISCSVSLVYAAGNVVGRDAVKAYLMANVLKYESVVLVDAKQEFAKAHLLRRHWLRWARANKTRALKQLHCHMGMTPMVVEVRGSIEAVDAAVTNVKAFAADVVVQKLPVPAKMFGKSHLASSVKRFLNGLLRGGGGDDASDNGQPATSSRCDLSYAVHEFSGIIELAYFPEQAAAAASTEEKVSAFIRAYVEQTWAIPALLRSEALTKFSAASFPDELREKMGLSQVDTLRVADTTAAAGVSRTSTSTTSGAGGAASAPVARLTGFLLCGDREQVRAAKDHLQREATKTQTIQLVNTDATTAGLLRMTCHKAALDRIVSAISDEFGEQDVCVQAVFTDGKEAILRITGPQDGSTLSAGPTTRAVLFAQAHLEAFRASMKQKVVTLNEAESAYFMDGDGKAALDALSDMGIYCKRMTAAPIPTHPRLLDARLAAAASATALHGAGSRPRTSRILASAHTAGGIEVQVAAGNALAGDLDARIVVLSANVQLMHRGGFAYQVSKAAGPRLHDACQTILSSKRDKQLAVTEVAVTDAFDLSSAGFTKVLHAATPPDHLLADSRKHMGATMFNILVAAAQQHVDSVLIPTLGTGVYGWPVEAAADAMLAGIAMWSQSARPYAASLKRVILMDFDETKAREVVAALEARSEAVARLGTKQWKSAAIEATLPRFVRFSMGSGATSASEGATLAAAGAGAAYTFAAAPSTHGAANGIELTGPGSALDDAESRVRAALSAAKRTSRRAISLTHIPGSMLLKTNELRQHLASQKIDVEVLIDAAGDANAVLLVALGDNNLMNAERQAADWVTIKMADALNKAVAEAAVPYPPEWDKVDGHRANKPGAEFKLLRPGTTEYQDVENHMRNVVGVDGTVRARGTWRKSIVSIHRIENPVAYSNYHHRRKYIANLERNKGNANELWLKHGTGKTDTETVCKSEVGLDFRYSERGMFGRGSYSAEDACYCDDRGYRHMLPDGTAQLLLVRVAAGTIKAMDYSDRSKTLISEPEGFDAVRGDVVPPSGQHAVIVYRMDQAYPAYLITYVP